MARVRLHLARSDSAWVVSRQRLRTPAGRVVVRRWRALRETHLPRLDPDPGFTASGALAVVLPPLAVALVLMLIGQELFAMLAAVVIFLAMAYLRPLADRRRAARVATVRPGGARSGRTHVLFDQEEWSIFAGAVDTADRIADTWPELGALIDGTDADAMLADALWELAGVLARRQEMRRIVQDLDRPEFDGLPDAHDTVRELRVHRDTARAALHRIDADIARRQASLTAAEQAGVGFIREREMREAIRAAREALGGPPQAPPDPTAEVRADAGADLAEQTRAVLAAYRELTTGTDPDPLAP